MPKKKLREKSLEGWTRMGWYKVLRILRSGGSVIQVPCLLRPNFPIHKLNSKMKFVKVRITIQELGGK